MSVVVAYDVDSEWNEVKKQAFALGFYNIVETRIGPRVLPYTTLFIENLSPLDALKRFEQAVAIASQKTGKNIVIEKLFSGTLSEWWVRSNETS